jgi:hypothetical protein
LILAWTLYALSLPAHMHAAGLGGTIDGGLVDKTSGASLQSGSKVYLYRLRPREDPQQTDQSDVDANGHFHFGFVELDPANSYEVGVQYGGAPYFSDKITFGSDETQRQVSIDVYEPTDDDKVLTLAGTSLLIDPNEQTHELSVLELDSFSNDSQRAFIPNTTPRGGGPPPLLRFSLPANASDLTPGQGMTADEVIQISTGFGALTPISPGRHDVGFTYRSAYQTSSMSFTKNVIYPSKTFRVLMPAGRGQVDSPQLTRQPRQTIGGKQYELLLGSDFAPGSKIDLRFSSLPGVSPLADLSQPSTLPWLAGAMGLAVAILLAWYLRDRLRGAAPAPATADRHELVVERRELLVAMARLDDRFDEGKLSREDYQSQRDAYKEELREVMLQLEAMSPATQPA